MNKDLQEEVPSWIKDSKIIESCSKRAKPSFCQWFDPYNMEHITAYRFLQDTGTWPPTWDPPLMFLEQNWQAILAFKLANAWIEHKLLEAL